MKILFFSYAYPNPINPGLGTFNRTMIAGLASQHDVRVVSPVPFTDAWKAWSKGRLPHGLNDSSFQAVKGVPAEYCTWYYTPKLFRNHYGRFMQQSVSSVLNHTMTEFQPDLVLSYWTHPDGEVAVRTAHHFGVRAVTIVGGSDVLINGRHGSRRDAILNVLHEADGVVAVSDDIRQVLVADGIPERKMHVVRRGIDRRVFHDGDMALARRNLGLSNDRPIFISVGRLVDVKGHEFLINACRELVDRDLLFRCYLLGDGPLRPELTQQIEQLGLGDYVRLRGSQSASELAEWYCAADLSVLASLSEGVPNVLLESIACGTPFVATDVGGISEIADPSADRLVPAANPNALADAIFEQLNKVQGDSSELRRFQPPTMSESAENLSSVLLAVQLGQPKSVAETLIMHETMADADSTTFHSSANTTVSTDRDKMPDESASTDFSDSDDDLLARTGEDFHLSKPIEPVNTVSATTSTTTANANVATGGIRHTKTADVATVPYAVGTSDDEFVGRTAEGFYYRS